jgi:hypothetical protein
MAFGLIVDGTFAFPIPKSEDNMPRFCLRGLNPLPMKVSPV